jgi:hypothetical protein
MDTNEGQGMTSKTYTGSCHCGAVKFSADIDLSAGTGKCNCSLCAKGRFWGSIVKPDAFRLLAGEDHLGDYHFGSHAVHWMFCKTCGVRVYYHADIEAWGGAFVGINLACLDDATDLELAEAPVRYADGRNNDWAQMPAETRHL